MSRMPPPPINEPILSYAPRSPERTTLSAELLRQKAEVVDIPMVIDGKEVRTGSLLEARSPHEHRRVLGRAHQGGAEEVRAAIDAAHEARPGWAALPVSERAAIFLRAAEALATKDRARINAATMLGQSKTAYPSRDRRGLRARRLPGASTPTTGGNLLEQPAHAPGIWNRIDLDRSRASSRRSRPFNFTAIAGNLPTAPAMMGNTSSGSPSPNALLAAHHVMSILREAGLPDGVINLVMGDRPFDGGAARPRPAPSSQACISPAPRRSSTIDLEAGRRRIDGYRPSLASSARPAARTSSSPTPRPSSTPSDGARARRFRVPGQKCSAASRAYVPPRSGPRCASGSSTPTD
jgi:1-pyrroline-5-carboxylate dehydrogenase